MAIIVNSCGLGAVCDPADIAEGLCDPNIGAPDFSITTTQYGPAGPYVAGADGTTNGGDPNTFSLASFFNTWGGVTPNQTTPAGVIANQGLLANYQRPPGSPAAVATNPLKAAVTGVTDFLSRHAPAVAITVGLMLALTATGGGPFGISTPRGRRR